MNVPDEPQRGGVVPAALLGACLMSIAAAGAALPPGLRLFSLTAGSIALSFAAATAAVVIGAVLGALPRAPGGGRAGAASRPEVLAAGLALSLSLAPVLFFAGRAVYLALWPFLGGKSAGVFCLRLLLAFFLVGPPAFLLARLLMALARQTGGGPDGMGIAPGFSLGLGAAGLSLGVLCGGAVLLSSQGMKGSFYIALALAGIGASAAFLLGRNASAVLAGAAASGHEGAPAAAAGGTRLVRLATFLFGFAFWCAFLAWDRTLGMILGPTEQTGWVAGAMLLLGLAFGGLMMSAAGSAMRSLIFVPLATASAILIYCSAFVVPLLAVLYVKLAPGYAAGGMQTLLSAIVCLLLVLPAALVQGAVLAGLPDLGTTGGADAARRTGSALSTFLLGVLLAALMTPLLLVPAQGLRRTLSLAAAIALVAAALLFGEMPFRPLLRRGLAAAALAVVVIFALFPAPWDPRIVAAGLYRYAATAPERFGSSDRYLEERRKRAGPLFFREGPEACVIVDATLESAPGAPDLETYVLSVDGRSAANDGADLRTQILTGEIPVLLHGPTEAVLLVDYLTGETAGSILRHPVHSLTVVEREPAVQKAGSLFIEDAESPLRDKRLRNVVDSPRARLLAEPDRYDVIVLTATDPWLPHTAALITEEGYALMRRRLQPHGLLAQRLSLAAADEATLRTLLRTFARAFDSVTVFRLTADDLLLIGSDGPLQLNAGWLSNVTSSNAAVANDLKRAVALGPNEIVMSLRLGGDALRRLLGDGPVNDDDRSEVQVASVRDLAVHRNTALVRDIDGAWNGFGPLLDNFGATPREQSDFLYNLAKSLLGLAADPDRALEVSRQLAGMGESARAGWVTGEALLQKKDIEGAVREWESVLAKDPSNLDAMFSLGTFYLDSNDYFEADRYLGQAARLHPEVAVARYHHGRALVYLARHEQAISELRKARELAGGGQAYPLVDYLVGLSAARLGRNAEAAQALEDYLKWAYDHSSILTRVEVDAHLKLADVFDRQGKRFDALRQRQKADQLRGRIEAYARSQQGAKGATPEANPSGVPPDGAPTPLEGGAAAPAEPNAPAGATAPPGPPGEKAPPQSDGR